MALILIVDDQNTNRQIYAQIARRIEAEIEVVTCSGPIEALSWLAQNSPDLILTDFSMPGMQGDDFITQIRADRRLTDIPVIVITVYEDRRLRLRALDAGATDLLISPVDHREFIAPCAQSAQDASPEQSALQSGQFIAGVPEEKRKHPRLDTARK